MVDKLNLSYSGNQINAEPISVPSASPHTLRVLHNRLVSGSVEIWQNNDKTGIQLTEELYTGTVSESGKFQVDYDGAQDRDVQYRNTILFHSAQAGTNWFIWYKSIGDIIDANDFNAKVDKVVGGAEDNLVALDSIGKIKDAGKKVSDFELVIPVKKTAFNKDFGTAADTVCEGNDSRLSDTRIPKAHASTHVTGGTDIIPNAVAGGNSGLMSGADKSKLDDATAINTASKLVLRDSNARAQFADPSADQDAATKKYVDDGLSPKANKVSSPTTNNFAGLTAEGDIQDSGKKSTDFAQNANTTGTIYLKTVNNELQYSTDGSNYIQLDCLTDVYGLEWNKTTDSYTRLGAAAGKSRSFFDSIYPWAGMRRCVLNNLGQIVAYYGEAGFVENGSTGQVMVRIPKFYYRAESFTNGYRWYVSPKPQGGFRVHPAFIRNGVEKDCIYISAYEGCLYDVSALSYITNDAQVADFTSGTGDKLSSIAGAKPCSGLTQNLTLPNSRILAHNRGSGWELQDFLTSSAIQLLYLIEYATFNSQAQIGRGVVDKTDDNSTNMAVNTGATSSLGNASGKASGTDGLVSVSYRGIENFWGNIWKWVDGLNIQADNKPWVADHSFASDTFTSPYTYLNGTLATTNGYAKDILFNSSIDCGFLPTVVGGSENSYLCDSYWQNTGNKVARLGGFWADGSGAGALCWFLDAASSTRYRDIGARLLYVP